MTGFGLARLEPERAQDPRYLLFQAKETRLGVRPDQPVIGSVDLHQRQVQPLHGAVYGLTLRPQRQARRDDTIQCMFARPGGEGAGGETHR